MAIIIIHHYLNATLSNVSCSWNNYIKRNEKEMRLEIRYLCK
jgi:hypothetical protein